MNPVTFTLQLNAVFGADGFGLGIQIAAEKTGSWHLPKLEMSENRLELYRLGRQSDNGRTNEEVSH